MVCDLEVSISISLPMKKIKESYIVRDKETPQGKRGKGL